MPEAIPTMTPEEEMALAPSPLYAGLTPKQLHTVHWLCTPAPLRSTRKELAALLHVDGDTVRRWTMLPAVVEAVSAIKRSLVRGTDVPGVMDAQIAKALEERDTAAARLVLDYAGELRHEATAASVTVQIAFVPSSDAPNPLKNSDAPPAVAAFAEPRAVNGGRGGDEPRYDEAEGVGASDSERDI